MFKNIDEVPANTVGFGAASAFAPFPLWGSVLMRDSIGTLNYNAANVSVHKRFSGGLQFQASYTFARELADSTGYDPTGASSSMGGMIADQFHPGADYGNVAFTARQRFLATFLYELPLGKGKRFAGSANGALDRIIGGWEVAGVIISRPVLLCQSFRPMIRLAPALTYFKATDGRTLSPSFALCGPIAEPVDQPGGFRHATQQYRPVRRLVSRFGSRTGGKRGFAIALQAHCLNRACSDGDWRCGGEPL